VRESKFFRTFNLYIGLPNFYIQKQALLMLKEVCDYKGVSHRTLNQSALKNFSYEYFILE